jgi:D-arabinose 1-dehydrogenase-like Zn-dependent alcohol dehydrogenase
MEAAGIVNEVGSGVPDRPKVGDAVMAIVVPKGSHGAYREQIVLDARLVVRAPTGKTHAEACSLPMNGLTARQSLDLLKLSPGQVIAVIGAAGAYGGYIVRLAKAEGLTVIADASERDEKLVALLGADIVVRRGDDVASRISRAFRSGISTSRQPLCAPTCRISRSSIGSGNRSRPAKSRFAWQRSILRKGRPTPIVGWRLVVREDVWSSNSNLGR